jgi:hypothetical protein
VGYVICYGVGWETAACYMVQGRVGEWKTAAVCYMLQDRVGEWKTAARYMSAGNGCDSTTGAGACAGEGHVVCMNMQAVISLYEYAGGYFISVATCGIRRLIYKSRKWPTNWKHQCRSTCQVRLALRSRERTLCLVQCLA